jgi:hypothetical protein
MSDNTCSRCGQHIPLFLHNQKELDALIAEEWALGHEQSACEKCADAPCSAQSHTEEARAARVIAARIRGSAIKEPILVWPFADAPKEFQACATGCNTADWLALVPAHMQRVDVACFGVVVDVYRYTAFNEPSPPGRELMRWKAQEKTT